MDSDFIIKKSIFLKVKRQPFRDNYYIHPKKIGSGAMGSVYRVRAKDPPVWRAAKVIKKKDLINKEELLHEINVLKTLDHPNIIKIYDIYEDEQQLFLVEDLCEGGQLFEKLMQIQKFTETDARRIFRQLVQSINYCHNNHVAHRDLKPENILFIKKEGLDLKLIDFGVSFVWEKNMKEELKNKATKNFVGTAYYVAPEILVNSNQYDEKCDIWSFGVILYILLSSLPPFDGDSPPEIFDKIKTYHYSLNIPELKNISNYAKDLIKKILVPPSQRISLSQILKHPWMTSQANPISVKLNVKSLQNFSKFGKQTKKLAAQFLALQLQSSEVEQLTKMFKQIDLNKDGEISMEELKQALSKEGLGYAELKRIMDSIDTDHNGKINYTQFLASASGESLFNDDNIERAFKMLDKDGNGFVQRQQLMDLFTESGMKAYKGKTIDEIMEECDKDGNGVIDFQQFKSCIKKKW